MTWYMFEFALMLVLTLATLVSLINLFSTDPLQSEYWKWAYALVGCAIFALVLGAVF